MNRLMKALSAALVAVLLALGLSGCATSPAAPVQLTQKDSGATQQLAIGQELRISLDANPTTGYQWAIDGTLPAQLQQVGQAKYTAGSTAMGAGGVEVWTFTGKSSGEGVLKLKYARSFEPTAPPARTFTVAVSVK